MEVIEDYVSCFIGLVAGTVIIGIVGWLLFRVVNRRATWQSRLHGCLVIWHAVVGFFAGGFLVLIGSLWQHNAMPTETFVGSAGCGLFVGVVAGNLLGVLVRLVVCEPPDSVQ